MYFFLILTLTGTKLRDHCIRKQRVWTVSLFPQWFSRVSFQMGSEWVVWNMFFFFSCTNSGCFPWHSKSPECWSRAHQYPPWRSQSAEKACCPEGGWFAQNCSEVWTGFTGTVKRWSFKDKTKCLSWTDSWPHPLFESYYAGSYLSEQWFTPLLADIPLDPRQMNPSTLSLTPKMF